jgi:hypothetical protein
MTDNPILEENKVRETGNGQDRKDPGKNSGCFRGSLDIIFIGLTFVVWLVVVLVQKTMARIQTK